MTETTKAGILIDSWKLPIFERHLTQSGYKYDTPVPVGNGILAFKVDTSNVEALQEVIQAAQDESKLTGPPTTAGEPTQAPEGMALVKKHDANAYCEILTILGMEEEGDAVQAVRDLLVTKNQETKTVVSQIPENLADKPAAPAQKPFSIFCRNCDQFRLARAEHCEEAGTNKPFTDVVCEECAAIALCLPNHVRVVA